MQLESRYPLWKSLDGTWHRLEDMTESHLKNCISYVDRWHKSTFKKSWLHFMYLELSQRYLSDDQKMLLAFEQLKQMQKTQSPSPKD